MKQIILLSGLIFLGVLLPGCEKADSYVRTPSENFEALWEIIDRQYCFFAYKEIDWDEVHRRYSQQVSDTMSQYQLFDMMADMMAELKDGHTNLVSSFNVARYWSWYEDFPENFDEHIQQNYLGTNYLIAGGLSYKRLADGQIGYVYYDSFSNPVSENNLDYVFHHFKDCKGIILDVRNNGGGTLIYSDRIAARFLDQTVLSGYIQHKTGPGHNQFSDPYPLYLSPSARTRWMRPAIVLTNRRCYSATNDFVQKMHLMPNVTIMGDRTGGGSGFPFSSELPNGWSVRFSASPMLDANKEHTEFGINPDVWMYMDIYDQEKGLDTLIEKAIEQLLAESGRE